MAEGLGALTSELESVIADFVIELDEEAIKEESKALLEELSPGLRALQLEATEYMAVADRCTKALDVFETVLKRQKEFRHMNLPKDKGAAENLMSQYLASKAQTSAFLSSEIPRLIYSSTFRFQEKVNEFLGQKIVMTYVFEGEGGPELYEMKSEDILSFGETSKGKLTGKYTAAKLRDPTVFERLKADLKTDLNFSKEGLKSTYAEVLERYRISRLHKRRVVLWYLEDKWHGMNVVSEGDINEAYAAFILLNNPFPSFREDLETRVSQYMTLGVGEVSNVSGLLQGDVSDKGIEYGIKSAGASTMGLFQVQQLAKLILSEGFSEEKIREHQRMLSEKGRRRNKEQKWVKNKYGKLMEVFEASGRIKT